MYRENEGDHNPVLSGNQQQPPRKSLREVF